MVRLTSFLRKYEMIEDFVCCQKFPIKENSRAWAWALEQNIMGLSFEHTQLILKHTQHHAHDLISALQLSITLLIDQEHGWR